MRQKKRLTFTKCQVTRQEVNDDLIQREFEELINCPEKRRNNICQRCSEQEEFTFRDFEKAP